MPDPVPQPRPGRREQLAGVAQRLREIRDEIERINEPYDVELGHIHARLAVVVDDLRRRAAPLVERFGAGE